MALERTVDFRLHSFELRDRPPFMTVRRIDTLSASLDAAAGHFVSEVRPVQLWDRGLKSVGRGTASLLFSVKTAQDFGRHPGDLFLYGTAALVTVGVSQIGRGMRKLIGSVRLRRDLSRMTPGEIFMNLERYE